MTKKQSEMLKTIHAADFAIYEVVLFLDTHPDNVQAMALLNKYRMERKAAIDEYEKEFGAYIVNTRDVKPGVRWNWTANPWPWDYTEVEK